MSRSLSQVTTLRRLARVYRRILVVVLPAALACEGAGETLAPDVPGDGSPSESVAAADVIGALATNRILFSSFTADSGSDVWTMDPLGGTQARLTSFTGVESEPRWSYDRKHVAFVRMRNGKTDIYLADADGTHKHWASATQSTTSVSSPSWAPNGTHLLVKVDYQGYPCLAKLDLATGNVGLVAPKGLFAQLGYTPVYNPAGTSIYFVDFSLMSIKRFIPNGSLTTVITSTNYLADPAVSPDGTRLAYAKEAVPGNYEIFVFNLATKTAKRLTYSSAMDVTPTWSPDGTKLAFMSTRSGKSQIYTMNSSTGGGVTRITSKAYGAKAPAWTP
jgi:Tol biopolymer transport system component